MNDEEFRLAIDYAVEEAGKKATNFEKILQINLTNY